MKIEGKVFIIGNIYIAPGNENQLHRLDNELKQRKDKSILLEFPTEIKEEEIDNQTKKLTDIARFNATLFFGQTEATKKRPKAAGVKTSKNQVLVRKKNNVVEPILEKTTNTYIFDDYKISEKIKQYHIIKTVSNNHDKTFRKKVEKEITTILENTETSPSNTYFTEDDIKYLIKISNKNSVPRPGRITTELIERGGETLTKSRTLLMQASYSIGYIPGELKKENKIYIKKPRQNKLHSREFI